MALTKEQMEVFTTNKNNAILIETLTISHSSFSQVYRICRYIDTLELVDENEETYTYMPVNLSVKMPKFTQKLNAHLKFQIDLINFELAKEINNLINNLSNENVEITYRVYASTDLTYPLSVMNFYTDNLTIEKNKLVVDAKINNFIAEKFPFKKYTTRIFRGLKYV